MWIFVSLREYPVDTSDTGLGKVYAFRLKTTLDHQKQ